MESFKEFVLEESAKNNYKIADFLKSQNKTADSITNDDIEEYYKINKINYTSLPKLDTIKKIMNGKSNSQASKELKNSSDGEFTKLAKEGKIQQFINKIKKYTNNENSELKTAANNALVIASNMVDASVVTEADENEELIKAAEKVDAILASLGDQYANGTPGEKDAIINQLSEYISTLASKANIISGKDGNEILNALSSAAQNNKDSKLSSLELRDFLSKNSKIKDATNLKFILALLWFKTQNSEMYKKALVTDGGEAKANNISDSVLSSYKKLVKHIASSNIVLDKDIVKLIGADVSKFNNIEEFSEKLSKASTELMKPLTVAEREKVIHNQSNTTSHNTNEITSGGSNNRVADNTNENNNNVNTIDSDDTHVIDTNSKNNTNNNVSNTAVNKENESNLDKVNQAMKDIGLEKENRKITINTPVEQVDKYIEYIYGNPDNGEENDGTFIKNYITSLQRIKNEKEEMYKNSLHKDDLEENVIFSNMDNPLLESSWREKLGRAKRSNLAVGRFSMEDEEKSNKIIDNAIQDMRSYQTDFRTKAIKAKENYFSNTSGIRERSLGAKIINNLESSFYQKLASVYSAAKKRLDYNAAGGIAHDVRNMIHDVNKKAKENYENSSEGLIDKANKEKMSEGAKTLANKFSSLDIEKKAVIAHAYFQTRSQGNKGVKGVLSYGNSDVILNPNGVPKKLDDEVVEAIGTMIDGFNKENIYNLFDGIEKYVNDGTLKDEFLKGEEYYKKQTEWNKQIYSWKEKILVPVTASLNRISDTIRRMISQQEQNKKNLQNGANNAMNASSDSLKKGANDAMNANNDESLVKNQVVSSVVAEEDATVVNNPGNNDFNYLVDFLVKNENNQSLNCKLVNDIDNKKAIIEYILLLGNKNMYFDSAMASVPAISGNDAGAGNKARFIDAISNAKSNSIGLGSNGFKAAEKALQGFIDTLNLYKNSELSQQPQQPIQATVTTNSAGSCKIPSRMYNKVIRRKIYGF